MLGKDKIFNGPFNLQLMDVTPAEIIGFVGLKRDSVKLDIIPEEYDEAVEDGSTDSGQYGQQIKIELSISEFDLDDIALVNGADVDSVKITFTAKSKLWTLSSFDDIVVKVENFKTTIIIKKSLAIGELVSSVLAVTAV